MQRLREEIDADRFGERDEMSAFRTDENKYEMSCGICSRTVYVSESLRDSANRSMSEGLDNPLVCGPCQEEMDDLEANQSR